MPDVGKIKHCWEDNCVAAENEREVEKRRLFLPHQICSAPDAATSENLETVSHSVSVHQRHLIGHFPPHNSLISSLSLNNQLTSSDIELIFVIQLSHYTLLITQVIKANLD